MQFYYYYVGICSYHLNVSIIEAEKNFELAYKRENSFSNLSVTPFGIIIANALAIIKIHQKKFKEGFHLLKKCYSQLHQIPRHIHSELHSKIFYNLSKCYYLEFEYELSIKV